jgi:hypothetical protein
MLYSSQGLPTSPTHYFPHQTSGKLTMPDKPRKSAGGLRLDFT